MSTTYNRNILAKDIFIYPSANALDGGQLNTEENISSLADRFYYRSFVIRRQDDTELGMVLSSDGTTLKISKGLGCIEGRYIDLEEQSIDVSSADPDGRTIEDGLTYYVMLMPHYDSTGCIMGDLDRIPAPGEVSQLVCAGVSVELSTTLETRALFLGTLRKSGSSLTVTENPTKYTVIDISQVSMGGTDIYTMILNLINQALNDMGSIILKNKTGVQNSPILILQYNNTEGWIRNTGSGTEVYFKTPTSTASITVGPNNSLVYKSGSTTMNIIQEILDLKNGSGGGGGTPTNLAPATPSTTNTADGGKTTNGTSDLAARADHFHQNYIMGTRNSSSLQTVNTNLTVNGNITATGDITAARVYNAVWNDYADALPKAPNIQTEPGDIIAKDEYSDGYVLGTSYNPRLVVGVHSDSWGHLLGGIEGKLDDYIPVAVCGNVRVKVVGKVKIGDFIVASFVPGVGAASSGYVPGTIVGKALESKETDEVSRILMQVMLI